MTHTWESVQELPQLQQSELQIWRASLTTQIPLEANLALLSSEERQRAERYRAAQARMQFVVGRATLRILIGHLLSMDPLKVSIIIDTWGKPNTAACNDRLIFYNVAHSSDTVLIALNCGGSVGVDLEKIDRKMEVLEMAPQALGNRPTEHLRLVPSATSRAEIFYRYWAQKEAISKADGRGLLLPMGAFDIAFAERTDRNDVERAWKTVRVQADPAEAPRYFAVSEIALGREFAAAVAVEGAAVALRQLVFPVSATPSGSL
jgi:4'-phosphopantetheinyl transferase